MHKAKVRVMAAINNYVQNPTETNWSKINEETTKKENNC